MLIDGTESAPFPPHQEYNGFNDRFVSIPGPDTGDQAGQAVREKPANYRLGITASRFDAVLRQLINQLLLKIRERFNPYRELRGKEAFRKQDVLDGLTWPRPDKNGFLPVDVVGTDFSQTILAARTPSINDESLWPSGGRFSRSPNSERRFASGRFEILFLDQMARHTEN